MASTTRQSLKPVSRSLEQVYYFIGLGEDVKSLSCQGFTDRQTFRNGFASGATRVSSRDPFYEHFGCIMWDLVGYVEAFWIH